MPRGVYEHKLPPPSRKGAKLSKEHIEALQKANKGNKHSLGRKDSDETRILKSKNSARYWLGKKRPSPSPETRRKMSESLKGHLVSKGTRERMRNLMRGRFGIEHPVWTDDKKHPLHKAIRETFKYRSWRKNIFIRDNFMCVICRTSGYVEADHHPIRFSDILTKNEIKTMAQALNCEELWMAGGRTLCRPCHLKTDTWGHRPRLQKKKQKNGLSARPFQILSD